MTFHLTIFKTDGTEKEVYQDERPTLKEMQEIVGGYIERVQLNLVIDFDKSKKISHTPEMIVNENAIAEGLPFNAKASGLYWETALNNGHPTEHPILGNAIVFRNFKLL